jgi:hypothetical protein
LVEPLDRLRRLVSGTEVGCPIVCCAAASILFAARIGFALEAAVAIALAAILTPGLIVARPGFALATAERVGTVLPGSRCAVAAFFLATGSAALGVVACAIVWRFRLGADLLGPALGPAVGAILVVIVGGGIALLGGGSIAAVARVSACVVGLRVTAALPSFALGGVTVLGLVALCALAVVARVALFARALLLLGLLTASARLGLVLGPAFS